MSFEHLSAPNLVLDQSTDGPFLFPIYLLGVLLYLHQNHMHFVDTAQETFATSQTKR